ncbi:hypothetical protein [Colwellia sp. C1TZA3]|uniref:hypothetical protein n=1 Tax=Colwellia sp. C1TZA3 TaxID=2508879 RepID=UPI0011B94DD8|nr:hypothetical protein [Colwellia sp. C1TZA3]TWX72604.1 hypothetical protein ESZ39_07965 [Colwellia sp. C1TZA3]
MANIELIAKVFYTPNYAPQKLPLNSPDLTTFASQHFTDDYFNGDHFTGKHFIGDHFTSEQSVANESVAIAHNKASKEWLILLTVAQKLMFLVSKQISNQVRHAWVSMGEFSRQLFGQARWLHQSIASIVNNVEFVITLLIKVLIRQVIND